MGKFGESIGLPFALEGFAFFTEAIFLGIYLYGRERVSPRLHLASGVAVAVSGAASAFFVTLVNAFMNDPAGLTMAGRRRHPVAAMFSPSWSHQVVHVLISLLPGDGLGDGRDPAASCCCATRRARCTARRWRWRCRSRA